MLTRSTSGFKQLMAQPSARLVMGLGLWSVALFLGAVLGAIAVSDGGGEQDLYAGPTATTLPDAGLGTAPAPEGAVEQGLAEEAPTDAATGPEGASPAPVPGAPGAPSSAAPKPQPGATGASGAQQSPTATAAPAPAASATKHPCEPGADRTGVTQGSIRWALHAPVTFDGAPLNLAEDPIEGVGIYIRFLNERMGGVNGRKIEYQVFDDRYTVSGAAQAANAINGYNPFFVSGTLGVDQVAVIAAEARKRGIPYMAAGGSESRFRDICMFQIAASYDTHLEKLADFLAVEIKRAGSPYQGKTKVGVTALDSPYITPSVEAFQRRLASKGMQLVKVVTIQKPTEQTSYAAQIQQLKDSGAQIVVPAQDPISTSRMVQECVTQRCGWNWSFSNFAHESDTALSLMGGNWNGARGLAGGCYYLPGPNHNPYDPSKCGALNQAHDQWVAINGEDDWVKDGQGGASGYQIVHFWLKAMKDAGPDLTRQRLFAGMLAYDNYNDLVSSPISYRDKNNLAHGAEGMVVYQAGVDKYQQLTPGFVDGF
ncbi:MAG TPA: ABC transporter substrate-binding protein [Acidimicrobiales bacterium]|nr:ABC transporter substrate-binding protein [Acidimicrobiales bacterium]